MDIVTTPSTKCPHCQQSWRIGERAQHAADCPLVMRVRPIGPSPMEMMVNTTEVPLMYDDKPVVGEVDAPAMRVFETGATRSPLVGKPSYMGYLSPLVLERYGCYMLAHEVQEDGQRREAGNWKKGMPPGTYLDSLLRHLMDWWLIQEGYPERARTPDLEEALCGVLFNVCGALHEALKEQQR